MLYYDIEEYKMAKHFYEWVLEIQNKVLGHDYLDVVTTKNDKDTVDLGTKEYQNDAKSLYERNKENEFTLSRWSLS